MLHNRHITQFT